MLSADDLRKQLTAAEAYNRFMEKRVRMLELEVKMLQSASNFATLAREHADRQDASPPIGGRDATSPRHKDARDMTAGQILEELTRLRTDHKSNVSELKRVKKDLAMASANLQHMTAKEQQQRQRVAQLSEEVRQLRSLLPPHLFEVADGWATRTRGGATFDGSEDDRQSTIAAPGSGAGTQEGRSAATPAARANVQSSEAANAVRKLSADVAAFSESLLLLPNHNFTSVTAAAAATAAPSQLPYDLTQVLAVSERAARFRDISQRVHTVLRFSKKELVDPAESAAALPSGSGSAPAAVVLRTSTAKKVDRTMQQLEGLLSLVERCCDRLKEAVLELPKSVAQYLSKCRSGISLVVDGQRANTPSAVAALQAQAQQLVSELGRHREDFKVGLHNVRHHMAALCSVMMSAADAALGINMYRNLAHAPKLVAALESHVVLLFGLDHALELEALREYAGKTAGDTPWYAEGIELECEVRRLSLLDPKTDRIEKMDILSIKKLFPDTLSMAAASAAASGGGMNPAFAEAVVMLETIKTTSTQLCRLFRGELLAGAGGGSVSGGGGGLVSSFDGDLVASKGVQCNLQQQKMELTDNELHIARLAGIRSNWFDAALESQGGGNSAQVPGGDASLTASLATVGNVTPRSGGAKTPRGAGAGAVASSAGGPNTAANIATLVKEFLARYPNLDIPANIGPYRPKVQLARFTSDEGTFYHFGRRVISLRMGSNGQSLIVHIGGGYLTLEEFCLKYGPTEARMTERRKSPSPDRAGSPPAMPPTTGTDGSPGCGGGGVTHLGTQRPSSIPKLRKTPSLGGVTAL